MKNLRCRLGTTSKNTAKGILGGLIFLFWPCPRLPPLHLPRRRRRGSGRRNAACPFAPRTSRAAHSNSPWQFPLCKCSAAHLGASPSTSPFCQSGLRLKWRWRPSATCLTACWSWIRVFFVGSSGASVGVSQIRGHEIPTVQYQIWDGACLIPIQHITSQIGLELVGIEGNHPSSTRARLLGSYRSRVSM